MRITIAALASFLAGMHSPIYAADDITSCRNHTVQYAELQDMSAEEQLRYYCKLESGYLSQQGDADLVKNSGGLSNSLSPEIQLSERRKFNRALEERDFCKQAMDSAARLLKRRGVGADGMCERKGKWGTGRPTPAALEALRGVSSNAK